MSIAPHAGAGGLTNTKLALANAVESDVLSGKKFYAKNKELKTGRMRNNGRWPDADKFTLENGKIYMYKQNGYTEGGLGSAASQLGNARAAHVLSGASASSQNGIGFAGTMPNRENWSASLEPGGSVTVPQGYHGGDGTVSVRGINNNDILSRIKHATTTSRYVSNPNIYIIGIENIAGVNDAYFDFLTFYLSKDHHTATWSKAPGTSWTYAYIDC